MKRRITVDVQVAPKTSTTFKNLSTLKMLFILYDLLYTLKIETKKFFRMFLVKISVFQALQQGLFFILRDSF